MKLSLVIPAYNEEKRLPAFLRSLQNMRGLDEIIIVDDGSTDSTAQMARDFRVIRHETNRGKGAAVRTGVMAAQGDLIIFMDADGATPITELPKMIAALKEADIAIGSRFLPGAKTERHSSLRKFSGWIYRKYMSLFGLGEIDTMCGFKGYHHKVAQDLFSNLLEERWLFDAEIAYKAVRHGYKITNFPIEWTSKDGSKLDTMTLLKTAFQIWPLIQKIKQS